MLQDKVIKKEHIGYSGQQPRDDLSDTQKQDPPRGRRQRIALCIKATGNIIFATARLYILRAYGKRRSVRCFIHCTGGCKNHTATSDTGKQATTTISRKEL